MKVLQIAHTCSGGAGIGAYRQHLALRRIGIDSQMIVVRAGHAVEGVMVRRGRRFDHRLSRNLSKLHKWWRMRPYAATIQPTLEQFSDDRVDGPDLISNSLPAADVYNLHWIARTIDLDRFTKELPRHTPLVWTLRDMNPFTGGCHYSLGCERFAQSCGACPQLGSSNPRDVSFQSLERKKRAISRLCPETTRIVGPSRWTQSQAHNSALFDGFEIVRIPHGVDCHVFQPTPRQEARKMLGLPIDAKIVLFVADVVGNHRKGFDLLQAAMKGIQEQTNAMLVSVGADGKDCSVEGDYLNLGRINDQKRLALVYSAADVYVTPARAESFGHVVIESMACGTPVVAFDVGGIPDMVRPGQTGMLSPPEDVDDLRRATVEILENKDLQTRMALECRRVAEAEYTLDHQAISYAKLYAELISASLRLRELRPA